MLTKYIFLLSIIMANNGFFENKSTSFRNSFYPFSLIGKSNSKKLRSSTLSLPEKGLFTIGSFFILFKLLKK